MIRQVEDKDISAIAAIYNEYVEHSTATFDTDKVTPTEMKLRAENIFPEFPYFVYENDGRVVGYCYAHKWKEKTAYQNSVETTVYVSPEYKHFGIGTKLMLKLIAECRERKFHSLIACITGGNEASILLHEKLGFEKVSYFKEVGRKFDSWLDIVDYQLLLND